MKLLSDDNLIEAYTLAHKKNLDREFIELLRHEIIKRNIGHKIKLFHYLK